jgi:hypothetical protein
MANLTPAQQQMNAILTDLQTLVTSGVLNSATADSLTKVNPLDRTWSGFPSAVVIPPIVSGNTFEDSVTNLMEYTWYIMVVTTPDNIPKNDPTYLAGLEDNIIQVFNMDATLQGTANGAVFPTIIESPGPVNSGTTTYVLFYVSLKARAIVPSGVQQN